MAGQRTSKIWSDTIRAELCKAAGCRRQIWFAQNIRTGNFMPFDVRPVPIAIETELGTGRESWLIDLASSHFASCSAAKQFRRAR